MSATHEKACSVLLKKPGMMVIGAAVIWMSEKQVFFVCFYTHLFIVGFYISRMITGDVNVEKRSGSKTEPWGTPVDIEVFADWESPTTTRCTQPVKYELIQPIALPETPKLAWSLDMLHCCLIITRFFTLYWHEFPYNTIEAWLPLLTSPVYKTLIITLYYYNTDFFS